jgi:hypothetical protein
MVALIISVVALIPQTASAQEARWYAEFFSNRSLSGTPVVTRWDSRIDFNWGSGAPAAGVPADDFSARWTRIEHFDGGTYRFHALADDGFRLWVGSNLVIDSWVDQQGGWITRDVYLNQVYIPERNASTRHANHSISHADGYSLRTVNQSIYYGEWVSLGTCRFRGTGQDYVSLSDITGETYLSRTIGFDAVRWEPR